MTKRILSRRSYANLMATVAVFLALGGRAWAVVKGSGTITSRNAHGLGGAETPVASLPGIGDITALCDQFGPSLNFVNHSGKTARRYRRGRHKPDLLAARPQRHFLARGWHQLPGRRG